MKNIFAITLIIASWAAKAQDAIFTITDSKTNQPIEFAHIIYTNLNNQNKTYNTTDINGKAENIAKETSHVLITFIGYEKIEDTIYPGKSYQFKLTPGENNLNEIVVTGQYAPVAEGNSVFKVKIINQDYIKNRGALTVNDALNTQLNIRLQQDNVLGSSFKIQGLDGENVKILIDGVPVVGRLNGNIDLSQINMNNVERIEIIEGPMSVNYGSNALAGAINIITKNPKNKKLSTQISSMYESVGNYNLNLGLSTGNKKNAYLINGGRNFFRGWSEFDTTRAKDWNQKEQYFGQAKYTHHFKNWSLTYGLNGLWEQIKDKGNRRGDHSNYAFDFWFTTQRYINSLDAKFKLGIFKNSQIIASYTYYKRLNEQYNRNLVELTQELVASDTTKVNSFMTRGTFSTDFKGKLNFQLGYDINSESGTGQRISKDAGTFIDAGFFGSLNFQPNLRWNIQPGLRVAYNNNYNAPLVPSLHIKYSLNENSLVRFSYAHGFRAPSIKELYLEFVDQNHRIFGNPNIQPENSKNINLSVNWNKSFNNKKSLKVEPALYYNYISDKIQLVQTGTSNLEYTYQNFSEYETYGGKIEVGYNIHPDFSFTVGGGLLGYSNISDLENTPKYLYTPEYSANFSYWRASKKFNFNVLYKFTGATSTYIQGANQEVVQSEIPGYNWMDVTVTQKLWKNKIELGAGIKNLFDVTSLNYSGGVSTGAHSGGSSLNLSWGRTFFIRCSLTI